jgi:hypothetical protein
MSIKDQIAFLIMLYVLVIHGEKLIIDLYRIFFFFHYCD